MTRGLALLAILVTTTACGPTSPSPLASGSVAASPSAGESDASRASGSASGSEAASPTATPVSGTPPLYLAGDQVETAASSLRVRSRPGTSQQILVPSLPVGAHLLVVLGPVAVDDYGWYLVMDADAADPTFDQGWVASGFEPNPWLVHSSFELAFNPFIAGYAFEGDGEFGPVVLHEDSQYYVDWVASPPGTTGCSFAVDLVPGAGTPVPAIRAAVGATPAPGRLQTQFFDSHPELVGDVFVRVTGTCRWALTFALVQP